MFRTQWAISEDTNPSDDSAQWNALVLYYKTDKVITLRHMVESGILDILLQIPFVLVENSQHICFQKDSKEGTTFQLCTLSLEEKNNFTLNAF